MTKLSIEITINYYININKGNQSRYRKCKNLNLLLQKLRKALTKIFIRLKGKEGIIILIQKSMKFILIQNLFSI